MMEHPFAKRILPACGTDLVIGLVFAVVERTDRDGQHDDLAHLHPASIPEAIRRID